MSCIVSMHCTVNCLFIGHVARASHCRVFLCTILLCCYVLLLWSWRDTAVHCELYWRMRQIYILGRFETHPWDWRNTGKSFQWSASRGAGARDRGRVQGKLLRRDAAIGRGDFILCDVSTHLPLWQLGWNRSQSGRQGEAGVDFSTITRQESEREKERENQSAVQVEVSIISMYIFLGGKLNLDSED